MNDQSEVTLSPQAEEEIKKLSIGKSPAIYSKPSSLQISEPSASRRSQNKNPRLESARRQKRDRNKRIDIPIPPPPENYDRFARFRKNVNVDRINENRELLEHLDRRINLYDRKLQQKYLIIENDGEEQLFKPLFARIRKQMEDQNYKKYVVQKEKAIKEAEKDPIPIRSNREPHRIPVVRFSKRGLHDPHLKYREHQEREQKLTNFINAAHGMSPPTPRKPFDTGSLNYRDYCIKGQTRFFTGEQKDAISRGRKAFPQQFDSSVAQAAYWLKDR